MWMLAVDTTTKNASVAVARDHELAALVAPRSDEQHSVQLFRNIEQAVAQAGIALRDIDLYAVANGPGAFTALRVGLTVVKGLAEMHRKPVVPVSVLAAVCEAAHARGLLIPIVNAYRGQVFAGVYEKREEIAGYAAERVLTLPEFLATLRAEGIRPETCTLVGPELSAWQAQIAASPFAFARREEVSPVLAEAVARLGARKFARGEAVDALHLEANYVRRSDAELLWKQN
ncbi:MAG TPA: tRNA (adenosine(37)-N6)-threonylcarbamoyltransferase complex dimerization subunit type 1 TsaB [Candidatus Xenobia bacterium]|nr:tRNA (adenosine(37)-N6)-threonylcarbamoyltransferase complex dimerization subunit type 1 TsaB [Candidatus Xenobia bacterium]